MKQAGLKSEKEISMKRFFCILLLMALSGLLLTGAKVDPGDTEKSGHYAYPIDVTSGKWFDYTVLEKSEMLRIDYFR